MSEKVIGCFLGRDIEIVKTEDYAYRNSCARTSKNYCVYKDDQGNCYVRTPKGYGNSTLSLIKDKDGKIFYPWSYIEKGTLRHKQIVNQQRRK